MEPIYQRKVDELGRVTLPLELRSAVGLSAWDSVHVTVENGRVILQKATADGAHTTPYKERHRFWTGRALTPSIVQRNGQETFWQ